MAIDEDDEFFRSLGNPGMIMRPDLFEQHTVLLRDVAGGNTSFLMNSIKSTNLDHLSEDAENFSSMMTEIRINRQTGTEAARKVTGDSLNPPDWTNAPDSQQQAVLP